MTADDQEKAARERQARRFKAILPEVQNRRAEMVSRMEKVYIAGDRDKLFAAMLDELVTNANACVMGRGTDVRALFILGEPGSGKSRMMENFAAEYVGFQPFHDEDGDGRPVNPFVSFEAPKTYSVAHLAIEGIKALGLKTERSPKDGTILMSCFKDMLAAGGTLFVHIDEMQHFVRAATKTSINTQQDVVKSLVQGNSWPIHGIFSGTFELEALAKSNEQIDRRKNIFEMPRITYAADGEDFFGILKRVIEKHARLTAVDLYSEEFMQRLMHAGRYQYGRTISVMRKACMTAIKKEKDVVEKLDFTASLELPDERNPFLVTNWLDLPEEKSVQEELLLPDRKRKRK